MISNGRLAKFLLISVVGGILNCLSPTINAQIILSGEILSKESGEKLNHIHVVNTSSGAIAISENSGFFSIPISKFDVVRFSSVGRQSFYFSIPRDFIGEVYFTQIEMETRTIPLKGITVMAKRTKVESILLRQKPLRTHHFKPKPASISASNALTILWEELSRKGREKRKVESLRRNEELTTQASQRFNGALVWEMTGLFGEEMKRFQEFCNLPPTKVINVNEYEFLVAVKSCYNRYKGQ